MRATTRMLIAEMQQNHDSRFSRTGPAACWGRGPSCWGWRRRPPRPGGDRLAGISVRDGAVSGKIKTVPPQPRASPAAAKLQSSHKVQQESSSYEEKQPCKEGYVADWGKCS